MSYDPNTVLNFSKSIQLQSKIILKCKVQVQIKSKKLNKMQLFNNRNAAIICILSVPIRGSDPKFLKLFAVRTQSKKFVVLRIQSNPSPVQCPYLALTMCLELEMRSCTQYY